MKHTLFLREFHDRRTGFAGHACLLPAYHARDAAAAAVFCGRRGGPRQFVGKTALAAVGGSDIVLINLIVNFFVGLSSGASVVISQHAGAQEHVQVSRAVHTAVFLAIIVGALTMLLGMFERLCCCRHSVRLRTRCSIPKTIWSGILRA